MKRKLKLFVWEDVLHRYGPGIMLALAHSAEEAREILAYSEDTCISNENYSEWREWWATLSEEDRGIHEVWYEAWLALEAEPCVIEEPKGWVIPGSD